MQRLKKRLVYVTLLLLTAWPLFHIYLVKKFDVSPWKLAGWGMYAAPRFGQISVDVFGRLPETEDFQFVSTIPPHLYAAMSQFLETYRWLRRLTPHERIARALLKAYPEYDTIRLLVSHPTLDRATGMVVTSQDVFDYPHP
jgi:hypothetical protein